MPNFQIDDYYEAIALYRLLLSYKYAPNPMHPEIFGSPFIATLHKRLAQTLKAMEIERGYPEAAQGWMPVIALDSPVWYLLINNTIEMDGGSGWMSLSETQKRQMADIVLAPFTYDDAVRNAFIQQIDARLTHSSD